MPATPSPSITLSGVAGQTAVIGPAIGPVMR
jgi:hypothetical protein